MGGVGGVRVCPRVRGRSTLAGGARMGLPAPARAWVRVNVGFVEVP